MIYNLKIAGKDVPVKCDLKDNDPIDATVGDDRFEATFTVISRPTTSTWRWQDRA
jgi:hypothetical protein